MNSAVIGSIGVFCCVGLVAPTERHVAMPAVLSPAAFSAPSYFALPDSEEAMQSLILDMSDPPGDDADQAVTFQGAACSFGSGADACSSTDSGWCSTQNATACSSTAAFCSTDTGWGCSTSVSSCTTLHDNGLCSTKAGGTAPGTCSAKGAGICTTMFNNGKCSAHGGTGHCSVLPGKGGQCTTWELAVAGTCSVIAGSGTCSVKGTPYTGGMCHGN